jgi:hypothetical protein
MGARLRCPSPRKTVDLQGFESAQTVDSGYVRREGRRPAEGFRGTAMAFHGGGRFDWCLYSIGASTIGP